MWYWRMRYRGQGGGGGNGGGDQMRTVASEASTMRITPANSSRHSGHRRVCRHSRSAHATHSPPWPHSRRTASWGCSQHTMQLLWLSRAVRSDVVLVEDASVESGSPEAE